MYSVVLISNAKNVTEAFNSLDLWENRGFYMVSVTTNFNDALNYNPDVIICPAKSEYNDCWELSKIIDRNDLNIKLIIYGRKTYEYAKISINVRAWGYLAMPLETYELTHLLINLKIYLDNENSNKRSVNDYASINDLRDEFFFNLLSGKFVSNEQVDFEYKKLNLQFNTSDCVCSVLKICIEDFEEYIEKIWKYGKESLFTAVTNFIIKADENWYCFLINVENSDIFFLILHSHFSTINNSIAYVKNSLKETLSLNITYSILKNYSNLYTILEKNEQEFIVSNTGLSKNIASTQGKDNEKAVIKDAKAFMLDKYNSEISLDDVANYVCLSAAYFSRLFKQETGENFIDYLMKVRMENAKKYLQTTHYKTYEISELVGYKKSKYFSKLFKNYTGYTPTEYKAKVNRKNKYINRGN